MTARMTRRESLLTALFGTGYIGIKALATGLPAWYLLNPRTASAQSLKCAISALSNLQYLIVSCSSMGDPINCNCPGSGGATAATYTTGCTSGATGVVIHPPISALAATTVTLGSQTYGAALPWGSTADSTPGQLAPSVLAQTCFFHHTTGTTVHGDQPKVMTLEAEVANNEMLVSAIAKHLAPCFGTVQAQPVALGAGSNAGEFLSFAGQTLPPITPTQLKQLLDPSANSPLVNLRSIRDTALDELNALAKSDGNVAQKQFLDALANSQAQVRSLSTSLASLLSSINSDDITGQIQAAVALIAAKVTPVCTINISFGADNHSDSGLKNEAAALATSSGAGGSTVSGVSAIQALFTLLASNNLANNVTFSMLNVFGRTLNNTGTSEAQNGRDHFGNHCVSVMIGKNVKPSVIGGIGLASDGATLQAVGINSSTGAGSASGNINANDTHAAQAMTLCAALGIPQSVWTSDFLSGTTAVPVPAAVTSVP
jgi:hypothetical protein